MTGLGFSVFSVQCSEIGGSEAHNQNTFGSIRVIRVIRGFQMRFKHRANHELNE